MKRIRAIDLFCGAGGSSWGARQAGATIVAGFDAWSPARTAFQENFPESLVFGGRLEGRRLADTKRRLGKIDLVLASPECTSHSVAKGAAARSRKSRDTALQVLRFAASLEPRWIVIENVLSMKRWSRYRVFVQALRDLGYNVREQVLNAADFGVPQQRQRLFLLCDKRAEPPEIKGTTAKWTAVSSIVDMNGTYPFTPLRAKRRAKDTLTRARRATRVLGSRSSFLLVYYGTDGAGGWQRLSRPLRTITTLDRFALVKPKKRGHKMRMLQVPELKSAMGMPQSFSVGDGVRREKIHLIGNAVCPPVMRAIVRQLTTNRKRKVPALAIADG